MATLATVFQKIFSTAAAREASLEQAAREQHRVPADVIRTDRSGIALRFRHYDDRTYTALVKLLYSS